MGIIRDFFGLKSRTVDPVSMVGFPTDTQGGVLPYGVSATSVAGLSAVWRCLDVLGNGVSQLPWREHRGTLDLPLSRISRRPSAFYTRREWTQLIVRTLALFDVAYLLKLEPYDSEGVPSGLWPIPPQIIAPRTIDTYMLTPPTSYIVGHTTISADSVVVIRRGPMPGTPDYLNGVLHMARAAWAGAIAQENYQSRYWQAGGSPTTLLETDAMVGDTQAEALQARYAQSRARGPDYPIILSNGLKAQPFGADPTTQSAVESEKAMIAKTARYFGVPARMANAPAYDSEVYKTAQEENLDLLHYTLSNYIGAIEDAITDLLPGNREVSMVTSGLTEGTQFVRAQAYNLATGGTAWMSPPEVREAEGLPPQEEATPAEVDSSQKQITPTLTGPSQQALTGETGVPPL